MDTGIRMQLINAGIDVDTALERFMNNDMIFTKFLKKFLEDRNFNKLKEAVEAKDWESALAASHTLKGVCGNLAMTRLYELFSRQVAELRADRTEAAASMMYEIASVYEEMRETIIRSVGQ